MNKNVFYFECGCFVIIMYEETRMYYLLVLYMKNVVYGWIILDFKIINDIITILEFVIFKCNLVVKYCVLKGIYSNIVSNIK